MRSLYTYEFSFLYTTIHHNLVKDKLSGLIEITFNREGSPYLACNDRNAFYLGKTYKILCMVLSKCMWCVDLFVGQIYFDNMIKVSKDAKIRNRYI